MRDALENENPQPTLVEKTEDDEVLWPREDSQEITEEGEQFSEVSRSWGGRGLVIGTIFGMAITLGVMRFVSTPAKTEQTPPVAPVTKSLLPPVSVTVATAEVSAVNRTLKATGTVAAFEAIPVLSQAEGLQIQQILADEGDTIKAGQILAKLDDSVQQARLLQAQATVAQAQAKLAELRSGTRGEEIAQAQETIRRIQAEINQSQADLELARKRVLRNQRLESAGAVARDRLDEVLNEERNKYALWQQAQARLGEQEQKLLELRSGPRTEVIAQATAQLAAAQAQLQEAIAQLRDTQIIAPVSGKIAERLARIGDVTSSSKTLFTIIENGRLELEVKLPETQLPSIRPGQAVAISSDADSRLKLWGKVREIKPTINEASRQGTVAVDLPLTASLKPGMFLRAAIVTHTSNGLTVPMTAVLPQTDGTALVYLVQSNRTVKAQPVQMGEILPNNQVEILNGLQAGERLAVKGAAYLKEGDRISVGGNKQ